MLLAVDIGNTDTVIGVFKGEHLKDSFRTSSHHRLTADEAGFFITGLVERMHVANEQIQEVIVASVVPPITPVYEEAARKYFGCIPMVVSDQIKLPVEIKIDHPSELGADRIANASAAYSKFGGPAIVVDFGTAVNFDIVDNHGAYIGGVLVPGPQTSLAELARKAARLFEVRIEKPDSVVGKSTAGALKSGLFYGTLGQIDYLIDLILVETGFEHPRIIATGGMASSFANSSRHIGQLESNLTLEGLRVIAELNK